MHKKVIKMLLKKKLTLAVVESFTGGLFAATLTKTPGVSAFFKGGLVTYQTPVKEDVLSISKTIIIKHGVISSDCAIQMAEKGRALFASDICLSFTGNAGPTAQENKKVGEIYIALATNDNTQVYSLQLNGSRRKIRKESVRKAWRLLATMLEQKNK